MSLSLRPTFSLSFSLSLPPALPLLIPISLPLLSLYYYVPRSLSRSHTQPLLNTYSSQTALTTQKRAQKHLVRGESPENLFLEPLLWVHVVKQVLSLSLLAAL